MSPDCCIFVAESTMAIGQIRHKRAGQNFILSIRFFSFSQTHKKIDISQPYRTEFNTFPKHNLTLLTFSSKTQINYIELS